MCVCVGGWMGACVRACVRLFVFCYILFKPLGFCVAGLWTLIDQLLL